MRRTRSSHPWALTTRHPWRVTVRRNTPPPPPDVEFPPFIEKHCPLRGNRCIEHCHWNGLSIRSACPSRRRSPNEVAPSNSFGWRRFGALDHHAPWMARGERPWMARASPAQHVATSAVIAAPHRQTSPFRQFISSTTHRSSPYRLGRYTPLHGSSAASSFDSHRYSC